MSDPCLVDLSRLAGSICKYLPLESTNDNQDSLEGLFTKKPNLIVNLQIFMIEGLF